MEDTVQHIVHVEDVVPTLRAGGKKNYSEGKVVIPQNAFIYITDNMFLC